MIDTKIQQFLQQCFSNSCEKHTQTVFNNDLCTSLIAANIPLKKLNNSSLRTFFQKYCSRYNIPDESTIRKNYISSVFNETMHCIRQQIGNNCVYFMVDETTDTCGRYIAHLLIGILNEETVSKSYLIY